MTTNDPMAAERLRTILTDRLDYAHNGSGEIEGSAAYFAGQLVSDPAAFTAIGYERTVNTHGVHVRRVAGRTAWEVDPGLHPGAGTLAACVLDAEYVKAWVTQRRAEYREAAADGDRDAATSWRAIDELLDDLRRYALTGKLFDQDGKGPHDGEDR